MSNYFEVCRTIDPRCVKIDKNSISIPLVIENVVRIIGICSRLDIIKEILNRRFVAICRKRTVTTTISEGL